MLNPVDLMMFILHTIFLNSQGTVYGIITKRRDWISWYLRCSVGSCNLCKECLNVVKFKILVLLMIKKLNLLISGMLLDFQCLWWWQFTMSLFFNMQLWLTSNCTSSKDMNKLHLVEAVYRIIGLSEYLQLQ